MIRQERGVRLLHCFGLPLPRTCHLRQFALPVGQLDDVKTWVPQAGGSSAAIVDSAGPITRTALVLVPIMILLLTWQLASKAKNEATNKGRGDFGSSSAESSRRP